MRVLALMPVFNEIDILEQTLRYYLDLGVCVLVLDNGSQDGSLELASRYGRTGQVEVRSVPTQTYCWALLLDTLLEWSEEYVIDWCLLTDADTFLESPWPGVDLVAGLRRVDAGGFNVVNFDNFEFWPVGDEDPNETDIRIRLRYYTWSDDHQQKAWRAFRGVRNSREGGHLVDLPDGIAKRIAPNNFVMRHYRIRSYEHGLRKVFENRLPRFAGEPSRWHSHYDGFGRDREFFEIPRHCLIEHVEGRSWRRERTFDGWWKPGSERRGV